MRIAIAGTCLGAAMTALLLINNPASAQQTGAIAANICMQFPVTFFSLVGQLNRVYHCNPPLFCSGSQLSGFQYSRISGYLGPDIPPWLELTLNPNKSYNATLQNAIILRAKAIANAHKPSVISLNVGPYFVYDIQFFSDFTVAVNTAEYFIGAQVTYARCPMIKVNPI